MTEQTFTIGGVVPSLHDKKNFFRTELIRDLTQCQLVLSAIIMPLDRANYNASDIRQPKEGQAEVGDDFLPDLYLIQDSIKQLLTKIRFSYEV